MNTQKSTIDLDDPLSDLFGGPMREEIKSVPAHIVEIVEKYYTEACRKCGGTGRWRGIRPCFSCKGKGNFTFKTSPEARTKSKQNTSERKARTIEENWADFSNEHPDVAAWINTSPMFPFAVAMKEAICKFGSLTEKQLAVSYSCVEKMKARATARIEHTENAPLVDVNRIEMAFKSAIEKGIKRPKLRLDAFTFSLAPAGGKNAGSIYVKEGETYLGKITEGKFVCTRECDDARKANIIAAAADPDKSAKAYGLRTGSCSCCGRTLTKGISIDLGIGPICAEKFGW